MKSQLLCCSLQCMLVQTEAEGSKASTHHSSGLLSSIKWKTKLITTHIQCQGCKPLTCATWGTGVCVCTGVPGKVARQQSRDSRRLWPHALLSRSRWFTSSFNALKTCNKANSHYMASLNRYTVETRLSRVPVSVNSSMYTGQTSCYSYSNQIPTNNALQGATLNKKTTVCYMYVLI